MKNLVELVLTTLTIFSFLIDKAAAFFISSHRTAFLDKLFAFIINYFHAELFLAIIFFYILIKRRHYLKQYTAALTASVIITVLVKIITDRTRPFIALGIEKIPGISYSFASWNQSFPSWHTVCFFLIIPFISRKYQIFWIMLALIMAFSRLYSNVHYLSDVLFGALLGYSISRLCIYYFKKKN